MTSRRRAQRSTSVERTAGAGRSYGRGDGAAPATARATPPRRGALVVLALVAALGCRGSATPPSPTPTPRADAAPARTFADVSVRALQSDPGAHVGEVFEERFVFFRVWWSTDRARPHQLTTELPAHFEARIAAAPLHAARIEFPPADDALVERWREGTELCLRVRFLRLQETSRSPVFALVGQGHGCQAGPERP